MPISWDRFNHTKRHCISDAQSFGLPLTSSEFLPWKSTIVDVLKHQVTTHPSLSFMLDTHPVGRHPQYIKGFGSFNLLNRNPKTRNQQSTGPRTLHGTSKENATWASWRIGNVEQSKGRWQQVKLPWLLKKSAGDNKTELSLATFTHSKSVKLASFLFDKFAFSNWLYCRFC